MPLIDVEHPDERVDTKRGIEYRWKLGPASEDGTQKMAVLSVSHQRAGRRMYYTDTNSPAAIVARLCVEEVSPGLAGLTRTKLSVNDPRNELLLRVPADRFSKKELERVTEEARAKLTGQENVFRAEEDYDPTAAVVPEIRSNAGPDLGGPPQPPPPRDPDDTTYSQPDPRFNGPTYNYLRKSDKLPTQPEIADEDDPICKVKLFGGQRFAYYVAAATNIDGIDGPVLTGYCISELGPDCDEWGDQDIKSIATTPLGIPNLPIERDIHFKPMRLSEIRKAKAQGGL